LRFGEGALPLGAGAYPRQRPSRPEWRIRGSRGSRLLGADLHPQKRASPCEIHEIDRIRGQSLSQPSAQKVDVRTFAGQVAKVPVRVRVHLSARTRAEEDQHLDAGFSPRFADCFVGDHHVILRFTPAIARKQAEWVRNPACSDDRESHHPKARHPREVAVERPKGAIVLDSQSCD